MSVEREELKSRVARMAARRSRAGASEAGFSIVETVIGLLLMMVIGLAVTSVVTYAVRFNSGAKDRAAALAVAQQRVENLRSLDFTHASLNETASTGKLESPNPTIDGCAYSVRTTITDESDTLKTIRIDVTPLTPEGEWASLPVTVMARRASTDLGQYR